MNEAIQMIRKANTTQEILDTVLVIEEQVTGLGWAALDAIDDADLSDARPTR
jgi:hypothetical protein